MKKIIFGYVLVVLYGCATSIPKEALLLDNESLKMKQLQTRRFDNAIIEDLISASSGVIQDLGYTIEETESKLGIIVGSKQRSALNITQAVGVIFLAALAGASPPPIDKEQSIRISLVVRPLKIKTIKENRNPSSKKEPVVVRVTFQRIVWNTANQITKRQAITDQKIYDGFFNKLSKSVFLEGHKI